MKIFPYSFKNSFTKIKSKKEIEKQLNKKAVLTFFKKGR